MRPHLQPRSNSPPPRHNAGEHRQPRHEHHNSNRSNAYNSHSSLALLTADENAIAARKAAIRNFGASWIRPPGVAKTLQAQREEEIEMAEAEEQARQEQGLRDLQARQEVEEARARAQEAGAAAADGEAETEAERDLDDDIPDADADAEPTDVTFNEDSMLEGSRIEHDVDQDQYGAREEAELTGAARDEEELGMEHERNLDDSVPEAGSYQHTDTEEEDSSSDEEDENSLELQDSFAGQSGGRATRQQHSGFESSTGATMSGAIQGGLQERLRAQTGNGAEMLARSPGSLNLSSSILESSFVGSSPVVQRGRGGVAARRRGRMS